MSTPKFRTAFNRSKDSVFGSCVKFKKPECVKKSLSYAVDINTIYQQYCKTGKLPLNGRPVIYDENFINYDSLIESQKLVEDATLYFNGLPASIKNQYGNSLEKFVKALNNRDPFLIENNVLSIPSVSASKSDVLSPATQVVNSPDTSNISNSVNTAMTD